MKLVLAVQQNTKPNPLFSVAYLAGMIALLYFLMIRPQKKQRKEMEETKNSLKIGDTVVTRSGVRGKVISMDDVSFTIESGPDKTTIEFLKDALMYIVKPVDSNNDVKIKTTNE